MSVLGESDETALMLHFQTSSTAAWLTRSGNAVRDSPSRATYTLLHTLQHIMLYQYVSATRLSQLACDKAVQCTVSTQHHSTNSRLNRPATPVSSNPAGAAAMALFCFVVVVLTVPVPVVGVSAM